MHRGPGHLPDPQLTQDRITTRAETAEDETFLRRLNIAVRWNEFAALAIPPAEKVALLQQQYDARRTGYRGEFPDADFHVVECGGVPVGRFYVDRRPDTHHLVDIAILPDHCGQGIGTALLREMLAQAGRAGVGVILRVDHLNPAKRLYQRLGFVEIEDLGFDAQMRWLPGG